MLVTFHSSADWDYEHLLRLFERPVDLVPRQQVENSDTSIRRTHILTNLELSIWRDDAYLLDMLIAARHAMKFRGELAVTGNLAVQPFDMLHE